MGRIQCLVNRIDWGPLNSYVTTDRVTTVVTKHGWCGPQEDTPAEALAGPGQSAGTSWGGLPGGHFQTWKCRALVTLVCDPAFSWDGMWMPIATHSHLDWRLFLLTFWADHRHAFTEGAGCVGCSLGCYPAARQSATAWKGQGWKTTMTKLCFVEGIKLRRPKPTSNLSMKASKFINCIILLDKHYYIIIYIYIYTIIYTYVSFLLVFLYKYFTCFARHLHYLVQRAEIGKGLAKHLFASFSSVICLVCRAFWPVWLLELATCRHNVSTLKVGTVSCLDSKRSETTSTWANMANQEWLEQFCRLFLAKDNTCWKLVCLLLTCKAAYILWRSRMHSFCWQRHSLAFFS